MNHDKCDVLVVGAGIHGAAVALEAVERGMDVIVIERNAEAGLETSSASSKLIHGGLRYLESAEVGLVYECLREQRRLLKTQPDLVSMQDFYLPVYANSKRNPWLIAAGLMLYWLLSGCRTRPGFVPVARRRSKDLGLKSDELRALFRYSDAQTDDKQLTQVLMQRAQDLGCQVLYEQSIQHCRVDDGYQVVLQKERRIVAKSIINAAGPWVNEVASIIPGAQQHSIDWVQGTHIVLDRPALPACVYCESPDDGRAVFVLPWKGKTLVGTTELVLQQPQAEPTQQEILYLLSAYNTYFPDARCDLVNVQQVFSGIRVLPASDAEQVCANKRSRETVFIRDNEARATYVGIYGGKLTSHRATAEKALRYLLPVLSL